ncbi:MAG: DEAD/DEAH box helicase family protein, partial [Nanopusillaceae archaeon]
MIEKYYEILKNRPFQIEVIKRILNDIEEGKKYIILDSPTGSGKTIIALVVADITSKNDFITHIAVRTTEEIKRYLEDSEKIDTKIKVFPNKRKTCPLFIKSGLSGEEIVCGDCIYKKKVYDYNKLYKKLKKYDYDFVKLTEIERKKIKIKGDGRCIYHSFKKVDSKIYVSTYPYVFNPYLNDLISLEGEPDFLILDEAHNLLTTILNTVSISFKKYIENGFGKRGFENLFFQDIINEMKIIKDALKMENFEYEKMAKDLSNFSDELMMYIENSIIKKYNTRDINIIKERMKRSQKEIYIDEDKLKSILDKHSDLIERISFYWETYKRYLIRKRLDLPKKRWNISKILKLYITLQDKDVFWIMNGYKLEGYVTKFENIIKSLDNYRSIILMSGSIFSKDDFIRLYKVDKDLVDYIKVDIKYGKKSYEIIYNFSSRYSSRYDKRNIENLIGDIKLIMNNLDKYQLYMFSSYSFMVEIYEKLEDKERIFLDDGEKPINRILKTSKDVIFTYARSRFIEGIQLVK